MAQMDSKHQSNAEKRTTPIQSLIQNDLGVSLPLHISLSRPLVLKSTQKESFFTRLEQSTNEHSTKTLTLHPECLEWHSNESKSRWFLVIRLQKSMELDNLLAICNDVAQEYKQPLLYADAGKPKGDEFHISVAWSLQAPHTRVATAEESRNEAVEFEDMSIPRELWQQLSALEISFHELKARIGQDVHVVRLKPKR